MRSGGAIVITPAALALGGCALFVSLDGFSEGEEETASALDAGGDGSDVEAGGDGGPSAATGFCASLVPPPTFCNDFDHGRGEAFGWTKVETDLPAATALVDTSDSVSAPGSMLFSVPPSTLSGGALRHHRRRDTGLTPSQEVRAAYKLRVEATDKSRNIRASTLTFESSAGRDYFYINVTDQVVRLQEQFYRAGAADADPSVTTLLSSSFAPGAWHRIELRVTVEPPAIVVAIDGADAMTPRSVVAERLAAQVAFSISTTSYSSQSTSIEATRYRFDDFVIDVR